ncbi:MAG TPA: M23 family metallopeptidase, partial [Nitrospirae bacterium]|nr:M23 family metallopeptidase [Nitrospirota bacterium]
MASFITGGCASKESISKQVYKGKNSSSSHSARSGSRSAKSSRKASSKRSHQRYHVLKRGETLYKVARRYGVSVSKLKRLNRISDDRDVKIGTRIYLPKKKNVGKTSRSRRNRKTSAYTPRTRIRFIWPVKKPDISSRFGIRSSKKHDGIDIRAPKGTPIYAAARGKILFSGKGPSGYGKMLIIKHDKRTISIYAHNHQNLVREGEFVKQGRQIATVGRTGRATGYHVHFEIRV